MKRAYGFRPSPPDERDKAAWTPPRPRFNKHEAALLLSAAYQMRRAYPNDIDWYRLYERLDALWGGGGIDDE